MEKNRAELDEAVKNLRHEYEMATDWRIQYKIHRRKIIIGAVIVGFVIGGGFRVRH
jgi:hypothetical protein